VSVPARQIGAAIGDGMSQNILQRILPKLLMCAGVLDPRKVPVDAWRKAATAAQSKDVPDAFKFVNQFR
jgi:hypothetical protein